jgi:N-ethylmaleimide reductase
LIANGGYTSAAANTAIEKYQADAIAFARLFLANPDLPYRLEHDPPLNQPTWAHFMVTAKMVI